MTPNKIYYINFNKLSLFIQLLIFIFISISIGEILDILFEIINGEDVFKLDFNDYSIREKIFEVVFLAPLIETVLIQFLLIELFLYVFSRLKNNERNSLSVLLSGLVFGILHQYNISYMIAASILGWFFGSIYIFYKINGKMRPFFAVLIVHSIHNLVTLLKDYTLWTTSLHYYHLWRQQIPSLMEELVSNI